jgi:predicted TIM-barrel fold metal-dependent hydrolase
MPSAIVGHVWLAREDCERVLEGHSRYPLVRGVRSKPRTALRPDGTEKGAPWTMQDPAWRRGFAMLQRLGMSYDLRVPYWHLAEAAEIASLFPETPMVLNHTGFPWDRSEAGVAEWRDAMRIIAEASQVWLKVSELGLKDRPWDLEENRRVVLDAIEIFGIERCMFASNFPVAGLRASYGTIVTGMMDILEEFSEDDRDRFFRRNAATFYRLDLAGGADEGGEKA